MPTNNTQDDIFGGFSDIANTLSGSEYSDEEIDMLDGVPNINSAQTINFHKQTTVDETDDEDEVDDEEEDLEEEEIDNEDIDDETDDEIDEDLKEEKKVDIDETNDLEEYEEDIASYVQEKLFDQFGISTEGEEFESFKSVNDIVAFVNEAIKANSIPEFANDEVAYIDQYVRNGGNLYEYMSNAYGSTNLDSIDLSNENVQKSLIKEDLLNQGMSEARVKRTIDRMEDSGILEEEAEDALESIKEYRELEKQRLLEQQQKDIEAKEQANIKFIESVESTLNNMESVRGIPITKAEKNKLFNYMMRPTAEGQPQYFIDYRADSRNMIESAYFTMMKDKLVTKLEKKAKSTAAKKLMDKLADKGVRGKNQSTGNTSTSNTWASIAKALS